MKVDTVYKFINFSLRKQQDGTVVTVDDFNVISDVMNSNYFNEQIIELESQVEKGREVSEAVYSMSQLTPFRKTKEFSVASSGVYYMPEEDSFSHYLAGMVRYGDSIRKVEAVSESVLVSKQSSILEVSGSISPCVSISGDGVLSFYPKNITKDDLFKLYYLSRPQVPYYDHCYEEASNLPVFMPVGSHISVNQTTQKKELFLGSSLLVSGVIHSSQSYPYDSKSKDFEWDDKSMAVIIDKLIAICKQSIA